MILAVVVRFVRGLLLRSSQRLLYRGVATPYYYFESHDQRELYERTEPPPATTRKIDTKPATIYSTRRVVAVWDLI